MKKRMRRIQIFVSIAAATMVVSCGGVKNGRLLQFPVGLRSPISVCKAGGDMTVFNRGYQAASASQACTQNLLALGGEILADERSARTAGFADFVKVRYPKVLRGEVVARSSEELKDMELAELRKKLKAKSEPQVKTVVVRKSAKGTKSAKKPRQRELKKASEMTPAEYKAWLDGATIYKN